MEEKKENNFWTFFVNNRKFTIIFVITIILIGLLSIFQIKKESAPEVDFPIGIVTTIFPGASALDVEELVTDSLESSISSIDDIQDLTSVSKNSLSVIIVEFDVGTDSSEKLNELEEQVNKVKKDLPSDAEDPTVEKISFNNFPIIRYSLTGPYDLNYLKSVSKDIEKELESIQGVSKVEISGGEEREIQVIVDKSLLDNYGISISQVTQAISNANTDIPIGEIETANENYNIKFNGRITDVNEIEKIPVIVKQETPIFVKDVAEVINGVKERDSLSFLSLGEFSTPAISIDLYKTSEADTITVSKKANDKIEAIKQTYLPENIEIVIVEDQASYIENDLTNLFKNGLGTVAIVFLVLLLFIGFRESIVASLVVPLTFFITFIVLYNSGYTLNFITLFSLILALGILVDNAIVITEGMNTAIKKGSTPKQAALLAIKEYKMPLISGTLTTVFVFLPMLMVSGIMGEFLKPIPVTITIVLLSSLFIALSIITTLSINLLNRKDKIKERENRIIKKIAEEYKKFLLKFFSNKKLRKIFTFSVIILFIGSLMLPALGLLKVDMFTDVEADTFTIDIEEPYGTTLEQTTNFTKSIEEIVLKDERVEILQTNIGKKGLTSISSMLAGSGSHYANITVNVKDGESSGKFVDDLNLEIAQIDLNGAKINIVEEQAGPPTGAPIEFSISGEDLVKLDEISNDFVSILKEIPDTENISTSNIETNGEFVLSIDRVKAQMYGVNTSQLALILRNAVSGINSTTIRENGEDTDIIVRYDLNGEEDGKKTNINIINSLTIATQAGEIPVSMFTSTSIEYTKDSILHEDGDRVVKVYAYAKNKTSPTTIVNEFKEKTTDYLMPLGYSVNYGGDAEDIEQTFSELLNALLIGIFAILMLLVWQFNSFRQPFFVLSIIPLTIIGIFPMLTIFGVSLSFPGLVGIVALAGIVVNNAIILIDKINSDRKKGISKNDAIINAGTSRLRPIILTTITTIGGLLPLCFADPTWAPIAFSIVFGLIPAALLTLIIIPMLYRNFGEKEV